jgi:hypothetical protein
MEDLSLRVMWLTIHLHLVPRLRIHGDIPDVLKLFYQDSEVFNADCLLLLVNVKCAEHGG